MRVCVDAGVCGGLWLCGLNVAGWVCVCGYGWVCVCVLVCA